MAIKRSTELTMKRMSKTRFEKGCGSHMVCLEVGHFILAIYRHSLTLKNPNSIRGRKPEGKNQTINFLCANFLGVIYIFLDKRSYGPAK